ncbi:fungal-specific transcription factor domain-containing protein [Collybia nuda]|uniref:Fungal-specific transcription factor domain-containing protein n=1 Tax=Collybia nuda TaxID=64659 RepID=A0A9P5YH43_9AGAR|nr:fungal-specific transcription factor domain-containing protein [Collybia nuda]
MGLEALLHLVQASNAVPGPAAHLALTGPAPDRNSHAVHVAAAALSQLSQQATPGTSSTNGPVAEFLQQIRGGNSHSSSDSSGLTDLRSHFPNHAITGHLLYHFFEHSSIPWLWSMIHKPVFDSYYVTFSSGQHPPSFDFIALLAMVCASSLQFLPKTPADQALFSDYGPGRDVLKRRLYEFSRSILVFNHSLSPSLEHVQALILLAIYQLNEGSLTGYYNSSAASIRMAQSLWMNQDVLPSWNLNPLEVDVRRKVWWTLFILDRQQCLILRRPYIIHENHCDITLPQIDERGPQQDPMEQVFLLLQIRWSKLISKMWDNCFAMYSPTYRDIFHIEEDIKRFELDLPSSFRLPTLQVATDHPCVLFQNRTLTLQIYHSRVLILRPFLLIRQVDKDSNSGDEMLVKLHIHARYVCLMIWQDPSSSFHLHRSTKFLEQ